MIPPLELVSRLTRRHLAVGWIGLGIFLTLGIVLESLHGFKAGYYLDTRNATRRLMWTLAHTHGTLFSLINILFALCLDRLGALPSKRLQTASFGLIGALALMPLGFFLGGLKLYGGDPGPGILLVPIGAVMLLVGVGMFASLIIRGRKLARANDSTERATNPPGRSGPAAKERTDDTSPKKPHRK